MGNNRRPGGGIPKNKPETRSQKPEEKAKAENGSQNPEERSKATSVLNCLSSRESVEPASLGLNDGFCLYFCLLASGFAFSSGFWLLA